MTHVILKGSRFAAAALIAILAPIPFAPATAGSFKVNPVSIVLAPGAAATSISLTNYDRQPVSVRVTALRWTQVNGLDHYEATTDVIASPPIFTMASGARQLIRLGLRRRLPGAAYRVIVEEIPGHHAANTGIQVALRLDLPFYVVADARATAALSWTARHAADGNLIVEARNNGTLHSQILAIDARDEVDKPVGHTNAMGVVLPGSTRRWSLGKQKRIPSAIVATTAQGHLRSEVFVERP